MYQIKKMRADHVIDFAAEELKKYLRMMMPECGEVFISYDPDATDGFRLGLAEDFDLVFNEARDPMLDDVVHIDTDSEGGILCGSNPRSVLFAVYRFFKENGCRWLYPGIDGEYIPLQAIRPVKYHHLPSHRFRGQCNEGAESQQCMIETIDYYAKLEMNVYMLEFDTPFYYYDVYYSHVHNAENRPPEPVTPEQVKQWKRACEVEISKRGLQFHDMGHGWTAEPFDREDGQTLILANFGNHPDVIGGCKFSADWPGFTRRTLEQALPGSKCIFFNGAQGDVNHIDIRIPEDGFNDGYEYSRHMGRVVAGTVLQVFDKVTYADVNSLRYKQTSVHVPAKQPTPEQVEQAKIIKEIHERGRDDELPYQGMMRITVVAEAINFVDLEHGPDAFEMDLSGIAIGNVVLIGIPGEPFSGIGLGLKEAEGWDLILPTCLTNGKHGYFPMQEAFDEGGYESRSSRFRAGVAEYLIEEGKKLMEELRK